MSVFISYSSKDYAFVDRLAIELVNKRIKVWLDKWEMKAGDSLIDKIQNGLTESSFLLVVLSKNSINSEWCKKELNSGLIRELEEKKVVVIPILIDNCQIPLLLKEKLYADFRSDFELGFKVLIRPLAKLFSEHMGRFEKAEYITDYTINWGIKDNLFNMYIDTVTWYQKDKKTVLLQINIKGDEDATKRFINQVDANLNWLMKETIISTLLNNDYFKNLNILIHNDSIFNLKIKMRDENLGFHFNIAIRAVLMGEDTGNDTLINFIDFMEILNSNRESTTK